MIRKFWVYIWIWIPYTNILIINQGQRLNPRYRSLDLFL